MFLITSVVCSLACILYSWLRICFFKFTLIYRTVVYLLIVTYSVPRVGYNQIWNYLIEDVELKKQLSVEKPIVKGYNFYKSGKVLGLYSKAENGLFYVKSQVQPSYSTNGPVYAVKIVIHNNSEIQKAFCPCPAGNDGRCNHLAATLFAMEDIFNKTANQKEPESDQVSCTSKPCTWNAPGKRKQEPTIIQDIKFQKHVYGKKVKAPEAHPSPKVAVSQSLKTNHDYNSIFEKVKSTELKTGKKIGLSYIIPHVLPDEVLPPSEDVIVHKKPAKWEVISPVKLKDSPLSLSDIKQKALRAKGRLFDSINDRKEIAEKTKGQHETRTWFDVRQPRITASKCKRCLLKPTTSPTKAISEVVYPKQVQTSAMRDGIESESAIIQTFEHETGNTVHKSGFIISDTHPFLGASPDGLVDEDKIVEVKKIVLREGESHEDGMCRVGIYKRHEQQLVINTNHKYYYQIQQQLFCSKRHICHFIVSNEGGTHNNIVRFDRPFWENALLRLQSFYFDCVFPELVYPRILHGESRWNKALQFPRLE